MSARPVISADLITDLLCDPVMAAYVIFGAQLDVFQRARLRAYWWIPDVVDSSGFSTGKSIVFWLFCNLRAVLLPDQHIGAYYYSFESGKQNFWAMYSSPMAQHPIFRSQLGRLDESGDEAKSMLKGPACYTASFANGSKILMPAPNWGQEARGQAGIRFNTVGIDEWTKVEATGTTGIDDQILGRCTRPSWNQHHPLWGNHTVFLATAESRAHPAWRRYSTFRKREAKGDPTAATISYSYKDFSNRPCATGKSFKEEYRITVKLNSMKAQFTREHFLRECLGIWARSGKGWYSEEALGRCVTLGRQLGTEVCMGRAGA